MQPVQKLDNISWFPFNDEPLLSGPWYLPAVCDPQLLLPDESPDGRWHLFAHSWLGLHHYVSTSGIAWEPSKLIEYRAHSPFVFVHKGNYYLLYEKHDRKIPFVGRSSAPSDGNNDDSSRIMLCSSPDLRTWSRPRVLLDSRSVPFSADYIHAPRVSRPQLVKTAEGFRLYFGVSQTAMPDTGELFSRYFACAESSTIDGQYTPSGRGPLLAPGPDDPYMNLGAGSVRVLQGQEGFAAFQCSAYWDDKLRRSRSALFVLTSQDGLKWKREPETPILMTPQRGWAAGYIKSCDVRFKESENCWYCYYSANAAIMPGLRRESIGLLLGQVPTLQGLEATRVGNGE